MGRINCVCCLLLLLVFAVSCFFLFLKNIFISNAGFRVTHIFIKIAIFAIVILCHLLCSLLSYLLTYLFT